MAGKTSTSITRKGRSEAAASGRINPEARQRMIQETAYYRYVQRGYSHGHDVEDWLAAEADVERASRPRARPEPEAPMEFELQQSGTFGPREDEALKRIARQHPRRDIPRVESIEPDEQAPLKE